MTQVPSRRKPRRWLVSGMIVAAAGGLLASGWLAANVFVSPTQREADAAPPSPVPVAASVESAHLVETATAQGTVAPAATELVQLSGGDCNVVTAETLAPESAAAAGTVLTELCGRPVVGLPGRFKYYRDLWPGMSGPDVTQMQAGLVAAGFPVKVDGVFGTKTRQAVRDLYKKIGYDVPSGAVPEPTTPQSSPVEGADTPAVSSVLTDVYVPASELATLPSLDMVSQAPLPIGTVVGAETSIGLVSGGLVARVNATEMGVLGISVGTPAEVSSGGVSLHAIVKEADDEDTADGTKRILTLVPDDGVFPPDWGDALVVVVFVVRDAGEHQLVVPQTAVNFNSEGEAFVLRQANSGIFEAVPVEEIATVAGRSAVRPISGELNVGDLVEVG